MNFLSAIGRVTAVSFPRWFALSQLGILLFALLYWQSSETKNKLKILKPILVTWVIPMNLSTLILNSVKNSENGIVTLQGQTVYWIGAQFCVCMFLDSRN